MSHDWIDGTGAGGYLTLPLRFVDGRWELLYGGGVEVKEGTYGELRVLQSAIKDDALRERLTRTELVKVFEEGVELRVALRKPGAKLLDCRKEVIRREDLPPGCNWLVPIRIAGPSFRTRHIDAKKGGLWIRQRGVDRTDLVCSGVTLPDKFEPRAASSLNHACTLLSERIETQRISHTLNVYQHVFFLDREAPEPWWRPLDVLRQGVIAEMEKGIVAAAWRELEKLLGFRPLPQRNTRRPRRGC